MKIRTWNASSAVSFLLLAITSSANAFQYSPIVEIGTLGGNSSQANGINNAGQVVGQAAHVTGFVHAFLWDKGVMTDLNSLGNASVAEDINNAGQITGWTFIGTSGDTTAFLYENGVMTDLGTLDGFNASLGYSINDIGQIVGQAIDKDGNSRGFIYKDGSMQKLESGSSIYATEAYSINNTGQITGSGHPFPFLYSGGIWTDLGAFSPRDINEASQIVGAISSNGVSHAALWDDGSIDDLGTLFGSATVARAINSAGQVVGLSRLAAQSPAETRAFLWEDGVMTDLSLLPEVQAAGWSSLNDAYDINDAGQIVGWGMINGEERAFLLNTTPPAVDIEKLTNGFQADEPNDPDVPRLDPGETVSWTYEITNTGGIAFAEAEIAVTDSQADVNPVLDVSSDDGDMILIPGETWTYMATALAVELTIPPAGITVVPGCNASLNTYQNTGRVDIEGSDIFDEDLSHYCNPLDYDGDGTPDHEDNCILEPNGPLKPDAGGHSQRDTDGDGYGNICDPDFDSNLTVDFADLAYMKSVFFTSDSDADLNGDGAVDFADLAILKSMFFYPPGPSGL